MRHLKVKYEMQFVFSFAWISCTMASFHGKYSPTYAWTQNSGDAPRRERWERRALDQRNNFKGNLAPLRTPIKKGTEEEVCWLPCVQGWALPGRLRGLTHAAPVHKSVIKEPEGPFTTSQWEAFLAYKHPQSATRKQAGGPGRCESQQLAPPQVAFGLN